jgi:hypothetical protein
LARNNKSRLGNDSDDSGVQDDDPVAALSATGLTFATPTEFVELPSGGKYYPEGHPLHNQETVEIKFMTAKEEDILSSKTLLKQGIALERLLKSIMVDKRVNPSTLLSGDRNAILIASRITGYGSEYKTKITCPSCMASADSTYDLEDVTIVEREEDEEVTWTENNTMIIELPLTKVLIEASLLTGKEELHLTRIQENRRKKKQPETTLTDALKVMIVSINGEDTRDIISKFIEVAPARDLNHFRKIYERNTPNIDMKQDFECDSCGYLTDLEVPLTADFFWPKR